MGFKSVLTAAYPFLAAALSLGGPMGTMAGAAIGKALNIEKVDATPDGVTAAIAKAQITDPEALLKLQAAEEQFRLQMEKLGFDHVEKLLQIDDDDRASARAREIAVKDNTPKYLAYLVVAMVVVADGFILLKGAVSTGIDGVILGRILGTLDAGLITVLTYYFGSSAGSHQKDETILQQSVNGNK